MRQFIIILFITTLSAQTSPLPWLKNITVDGRSKIHTVRADADVSVSDGLTYKVETVFHDKQRAVFKRIYKDRVITQAVDGMYYWSYDGSSEKEINAFLADIVLGHQFPALVLFFDQVYPIKEITKGTFQDLECQVIVSKDGNNRREIYFTDRPLGMKFKISEYNITFVFKDWRKVGNIELPFGLDIDDGQRQFDYQYSDIRINDGSIDDFRAPLSQQTDEQQLLRLHRKTMDVHLFSRGAEMADVFGDSMVVLSGGEVIHTTAAKSTQRFISMLSNRNYTTYDDLIRPIVQVSDDGTLGWVNVQVYAKGVRFKPDGSISGPLEFTSAWISLARKVNGRWRMQGNVSNFKPGLK